MTSRILRADGRIVIINLDEYKLQFLNIEQRDQRLGANKDDIIHKYLQSGI